MGKEREKKRKRRAREGIFIAIGAALAQARVDPVLIIKSCDWLANMDDSSSFFAFPKGTSAHQTNQQGVVPSYGVQDHPLLEPGKRNMGDKSMRQNYLAWRYTVDASLSIIS
jgi:hypothetical protein